jgi:tetratricopeptide (TPR) repeat protein
LLGEVHFPTSCSFAAQQELDRAVALLHSFWRQPALDAFADVATTDANCGIAYWGIAMALLINPLVPLRPGALEEGRAAAEQGRAVGAQTERERAYIGAIAAFYQGPDDLTLQARRLAYEQAMQDLHLSYPEDDEAAIFYALSLNMAIDPSDKTYARQLEAAAVLEPLFAAHPNHPGIAHYLIHTYDYPPLSDRGLRAAGRYARIAPSVPHALHMPSHIFTRLGLWEESIATNRASLAAGPEEGRHALDYMIYAHLQLAQDLAAKDVIEESAGYQTGGSFPAAAIPARYAIERGEWADAVTLPLSPANPRSPGGPGVTYFAWALGAGRSGNLATARESIALLAALHEDLLSVGDTYWAEQIDIWGQEAAAWVALRERRTDEALQLMRSAADHPDATDKSLVWPAPVLPARELLGELLIELGDPRAALQEFEASQRTEPNRFRGLYGAARAAELSGDQERAISYYGQLLELGQHADTDRPELRHARAFLAEQ